MTSQASQPLLKCKRRTRYCDRRQQRGVALITALLIVSLATIMAVELVSRQYMDVRRTTNIMTSDQAYLQALTMEISAAHLLAYSRKELQSKFDDREQFTQAVLGLNANAMKVAEGEAIVNLDLAFPETLFNVNSLIDGAGKVNRIQSERYRNLVSAVLLDINVSSPTADELLASLQDWLDANEEERLGGAEDGVYETKNPPYKAANRMMSSISELFLVEGYTPEILYGIPKDENDENSKPIPGILYYVTALPDRGTNLNVNLLTERKMIKMFSTYITDTMIDEVLADQPYEDVGEFINHKAWDSIKKTDIQAWKKLKDALKTGLTVQSRFFVAKSTATLGNSVFLLNSLVYVNPDGTKIEVISRAIGTNGI